MNCTTFEGTVCLSFRKHSEYYEAMQVITRRLRYISTIQLMKAFISFDKGTNLFTYFINKIAKPHIFNLLN